jgi:hypothetical protein
MGVQAVIWLKVLYLVAMFSVSGFILWCAWDIRRITRDIRRYR